MYSRDNTIAWPTSEKSSGISRKSWVILLRRDISLLGSYFRTELHGAAPDARKLRIIQRRAAFFRFLQKLLMSFLCISQPLDDPAGIVGHGLVPGTLRDLSPALRPTPQSGR